MCLPIVPIDGVSPLPCTSCSVLQAALLSAEACTFWLITISGQSRLTAIPIFTSTGSVKVTEEVTFVFFSMLSLYYMKTNAICKQRLVAK